MVHFYETAIFCTMKRFSILVTLLLFLPLMTAFSQAAKVAAAECSHCSLEWYAHPDCCGVPMAVSMENCCEEQAPQPVNCPHSGLCQSEKNIPPVVSTILLTGIGVLPVALSVADNQVRVLPEKNQVVRPPPKLQDPLIYLFHCTFLI